MSSPTSSPPVLPAGLAADILTPSRKVQALLAKFDDSDDSDDGDDQPAANASDWGVDTTAARGRTGATEDTDSDDDVLVARKSKMAARLEEGRQRHENMRGAAPNAGEALHQSAEGATGSDRPPDLPFSSQPARSSDDELSRPVPWRRLLVKRKSSPAPQSSASGRTTDPPSPMFFPSPSPSKHGPALGPSHNDSDSDELPENPLAETTSKPKFLALVEKHRKQRQEKEAAEAAKRKAQHKSSDHDDRQRGSSPVEDASEDSDASAASAAKKLTQAAKPTRKASKKAVEEMKRETQRMSRNMQLAHQARTKKKITKESLLARFHFALSGVVAEEGMGSHSSATASSEVGSDAEAQDHQTTPPTSPPQEPVQDLEKQGASALEQGGDVTNADVLVLEAPPLEDLGLPQLTDLFKGKGRADAVVPQHGSESVIAAPVKVQAPVMASVESAQTKPEMRKRLLELLKRRKASADDEDLDVVTARGDRRKYAAFEKLPKRKAQETSAHLALRSLAHLNGAEHSGRSSMNNAELELSLRRAAREQAHAERQQKIDELRAKGVVIQTTEERERDQQEVEDLVERARQEAAEIQKREKQLAKKNGTYVKDGMDSDDSDDEDFDEEVDEEASEDSDEEVEGEEGGAPVIPDGELIDDHAEEGDEEDEGAVESSETEESDAGDEKVEDAPEPLPRKSRQPRVVADDEDDDIQAVSPKLPAPAKTPQSLTRSARKQIPGLEMSDDLPIGLSQAFAATMADSQTQDEPQTQEQDSYDLIRELPSPGIAMIPRFNRMESLDMISNSQPSQSQTQPLNLSLLLSQSQQVPESPSLRRGIEQSQFTPSQAPFEPTQDNGYVYSLFQGNRFDTPRHLAPHSTLDTEILAQNIDASPVVQRKGRLQRGRIAMVSDDEEPEPEADKSAFAFMRRAAKKLEQPDFDKKKSNARDVVDEAAEESDDEYAGLGGASDDGGNDEENDDDRRMIDHDTQVGKGDEAKLAGLFADRERKSDEAAVSKLLKDITTGALRRKRGANDDLDLSDEEDAVARRREAKRREFAKMRRELLKDEAVGKIAEDKKKEAFLRSIEDREPVSDDDDFDQLETPVEYSQSQSLAAIDGECAKISENQKRPLEATSDSQLNHLPPALRRTKKKPSTLAEIRESVSFLIEEPDSQAGTIDLGLSDSEEEPEAYVDLDRHFKSAEADENAADFDDDDEGLGDFIVDNDGQAKDSPGNRLLKKPPIPQAKYRAGFTERRVHVNVVNRLSLLRQSSSTSSESSSTKMAFYTSSNTSNSNFKVPSLLRRATTNSSISSINSDNVSATGVTTSRTERGREEEKGFIRKGKGGMRNAVNYQGPKVVSLKEEKMSKRVGISKKGKKVGGGGFLGGLFGGGSWG